MEKLKSVESIERVESFLSKIEKDMKKAEVMAEFFELTLHEPIYEKLSCAFIQTANKKEGILYEGLTNRFFYLKADKGKNLSLSSLTKSVGNHFPKAILDKMFWVCGNKKDAALKLADFGQVFLLVKPVNK